MPAVIGRYGTKIHLDDSMANAYDQVFELPSGEAINVITIRVDDGKDSEYIDMVPSVAQKILDDLKIAIPNATGSQSVRLSRQPRRRPEVRVRGHARRTK